MVSQEDLERMRKWWRRENPPPKGFTKSYSAETPSGDKLQMDLNYYDQIVRLTLELGDENGRIYVATIKNGMVIREKDLSSGRPAHLSGKIGPFSSLISCIPDSDLLECMDGAYGVSKTPLGAPIRKESSDNFNFSTKYDAIFGIVRENWWERFLRRRRRKESLWVRFKRRFWSELMDLSMGTAAGVGVYYAYFDYYLLGFFLAFLGLLFGGLDWIMRRRNPWILKVMGFMSLGTYFFYDAYTRF